MRTNAPRFSPGSAVAELHKNPVAGLTVREVALRYRVGEDKVRAWIRNGELRAINTAALVCGKCRWVIPPEALPEFERRRAASTEKPKSQKRAHTSAIDFYPDASERPVPSPTSFRGANCEGRS